MLRLAHLADIHVQDRRRAEYAAVFSKLYTSLRAERPELIVVTGDIFDNRLRASAHNLEDVEAFLTSLTEVAPVVLIAGNHDCCVNVPGSLDLLTPLLANRPALQPPRLTYWRHSGVYAAHGAVWTVIAVDGKRPSAEDEQSFIAEHGYEKLPHLCLFHEEVNGALFPNGQQMRDYRLSASSFAKYDLTLAGHIHRRQVFAPRAAYCGSLVQQNIGESHRGHGYVLWELEPCPGSGPFGLHRTLSPCPRGIDIPNEHGFLRVEVDSAGRDVTPRPVPSAPLYWEILHEGATPANLLSEIVSEYEASYGMAPRAMRTRTGKGNTCNTGNTQDTSASTTEVEEKAELEAAQAASCALASHEELIRELLAGDANLEGVLAMHRAKYKEPAGCRGACFRLMRFEFDNVYAFGPDNAVDFAPLEGCVSGVVAPNHTGKSSLIEALLFALYEEHPRTSSKKDVIHSGAGSCRMALDFELDGKPGRIEKEFKMTKNATSNSVYKFRYSGEDLSKGGVAEVLSEIKKILGGGDCALASSFQLQGGEAGGFIDSTPANRKKLLAAALSLGSFEPLERAVGKEYTAAGAEVTMLERRSKGVQLVDLEHQLAEERAALALAECAAVRLPAVEALAQAVSQAAARKAGEASAHEAVLRAQAEAASKKTRETAHETRGFPPEICLDQISAWKKALGPNPAENRRVEPCYLDYSDTGMSRDFVLEEIVLLDKEIDVISAELVHVSKAVRMAKDTYMTLPTPDIMTHELREQEAVNRHVEAARKVHDLGFTEVEVLHANRRQTTAENRVKWLEEMSSHINISFDAAGYVIKDVLTWLRQLHQPVQNPLCAGCIAVSKAVSNATELYASASYEAIAAETKTQKNKELINARAELDSAFLALQTAKRREAESTRLTKEADEAFIAQTNASKAHCAARVASAQHAEAGKKYAKVLATKKQLEKLRENATTKYERECQFRDKFLGALEWWRLELETAQNGRANQEAIDAHCEAAKQVKACDVEAEVAASELRRITQARSDADKAVASHNREVDRLAQAVEVETVRAAELAVAAKHRATLKSYLKVLRPTGGIGDLLLDRGLDMLERRINEGLRELGAAFEVELTPDFDVRHRPFTKSAWLPASLASGYQKFVLSLATRLAIWRLAAGPRPDALIIDEGFGACDEAYLEAMAAALEALATAPGGPRLVFVVSHVEALKVRLERPLEITVLPSGSRVVNCIRSTPEPGNTVTSSVAPSKAFQSCVLESTGTFGDLVEDPADSGVLRCEACRQSLRVANAQRHLSSVKHQTNVKRLIPAKK
jgi:DNA repair exonuclease SbcCD ATPase subunit